MTAANVLPGTRDLERDLALAQQEGLAANIRRALAFVGNRGPVEFQALEVRDGRWSHNGAAHALDADQAVALCTSADAEMSDGVYLFTNADPLFTLPIAGTVTRVVIHGRWWAPLSEREVELVKRLDGSRNQLHENRAVDDKLPDSGAQTRSLPPHRPVPPRCTKVITTLR